MRYGFTVVLLALFAVNRAYAHGTAIFYSTPVSPPAGMAWVAIAGLALLLLANIIILRHVTNIPWHKIIIMSVFALGVPSYIYFHYGTWHPSLSTGPEPGLEWAEYRAFLGLGWDDIGVDFLWWNFWNLLWILCGVFSMIFVTDLGNTIVKVAGTYILLICTGILLVGQVLGIFGLNGGMHSGGTSSPQYPIMILAFLLLLLGGMYGFMTAKKRFFILMLVSVVFSIALLPYIVSRALSHGWTGPYSHAECTIHLVILGDALLKYAHEHGNHLPEGKDIDVIIHNLSPYIEKEYNENYIQYCSILSCYYRYPDPYKWNLDMSGIDLKKLQSMSPLTPVITCPFHWPSKYRKMSAPGILTVADILRANKHSTHVELNYILVLESTNEE